MSEKKYVIFDLDGTLIDSYNTVVNTCKKVCACCSCEYMISDDYFMKYRSKDMEQMFEELAEMAHISISEFRKKYDELYTKDCVAGTKPIKRQYDKLKQAKAKGIGIIVITNKRQDIAEHVCRTLFQKDEINIIIGRENTTPIKPQHALLERIRAHEINPRVQCLMYYGDSEVDLRCAKLLCVPYTKV